MGQCVSRKAAGAFAATAASAHNRPTSKMQKMHKLQSPDDENNKPLPRAASGPRSAATRGVATSFGFKRRPATTTSVGSASAARRLAVDGNGNAPPRDTDPLTEHVVPCGRTTPKLPPPKKEPQATRNVSRFGFRQGSAATNRLNKVADLNAPPPQEYGDNAPRMRTVMDNNRNQRVVTGAVVATTAVATKVGLPQPQIGRYTLQSTQLPRPEPVRLIETKTAKTLANNSRKVAMYQQTQEDTASKDGSLTEDSGVGSHISGNGSGQELENFDSSPRLLRRFSNGQKPRHLEVVPTGNHTFDVRDLNDSSESVAPIPKLPSAFHALGENNISSYQSGFVRDRTTEYERHLDREIRRKISVTSSEGFSDDYGEEEKTFKDRHREKSFIKPNVQPTPPKTFLKSRPFIKDDSSPPSSDEQEWLNGGEAMADEVSISMSSSDESRGKLSRNTSNTLAIESALELLLNSTAPVVDNRSLLSLDDSKFAAVVAASNKETLLDDETLLSPVDSLLSSSETEENLKLKMQRSSSNSKDINEKLTPPSPGTPTNASNSLSLSDGKDDFLIDDEIADQPALVFEDTLTITHNDTISITMSSNNSENTIVDSTPKPKRRVLNAFEGSPLMARNKKFLNSRTGSLDTLSPCESIASDDLMMDYDYSQGSGLDDDRQSSGFPSLNETIIAKIEPEYDREDGLRNWSCLIGNYDKSSKCNATRTRLLRSRASTPESPRSLDSRFNNRAKPSATSSPIKPRLLSNASTNGYESDDSIRLDRVNHTAIKQDIISIKTMLLKLRRVLNETEEDSLMKSETHNPFESQAVLTNGLFNSSRSPNATLIGAEADHDEEARLELAELRRQVLFLHGQLEDKDRTVHQLQEQMIRLSSDSYHANSAPASTVDASMCNAATQTERVRPISAGPSLLNGSGGAAADGSNGSLVSVTECARRSRPPVQGDSSKRTPSRLWRKPGEPPSPQRYASNSSLSSPAAASSIPRRANSRTRPVPSTPNPTVT